MKLKTKSKNEAKALTMPRHATKHHSELADMARTCEQSLSMYLFRKRGRYPCYLFSSTTKASSRHSPTFAISHPGNGKELLMAHHLLAWPFNKSQLDLGSKQAQFELAEAHSSEFDFDGDGISGKVV
jgi:hypothetical protein